VIVALARREDVPAIVAISNWAAAHLPANFATEPELEAAWLAAWDQTHPRHPWLVARADERVVGFARAAPHRARGAYAWTAEVSVYVDPGAQGGGVGAALYERLIPTLRAQGYVTLLAGITPPNPASERLHARFGFVRCGTYHRAGWKFGAWHDVGYWELHLQPADEPPRPLRLVAEVWR
jgi:phosphinothricin acetyltransferase